MVFTTELSWPSLDEWDTERRSRKAFRSFPGFFPPHQERSIVGWTIDISPFGGAPDPVTTKFRVLVSLFHLLIYPFYLFRVLLEDVIAPTYHTLVFPGGYLLSRELFGLPSRRRLLQKYSKKGIRVEGATHDYTSGSYGRGSNQVVELTLPAMRKREHKGRKHQMPDTVEYAFAVGAISSLYRREPPIQSGEKIDLLCLLVTEKIVRFFTENTWEIEFQKSKYDREKSSRSLMIGSLCFPLGSLVFTLLVFLPGTMIPMYVASSEFRSTFDIVLEQYFSGQEKALYFLLHRLVAAHWMILMILEFLTTTWNLCYFRNCAEYYAEKKEVIEERYRL